MWWAVACQPTVPDDVDPDAESPAIEAYDPLPLVDPFIGTGGIGAQIASVTPGAALPFGMTLVGPDTRNVYGAPSFYHCAGYHYEDPFLSGFSHTHAHGMGVTDYGAVLVMPKDGWDASYVTDEGRQTAFSHEEEWASPGRYGVRLPDEGVTVDIVATRRGAHHRYVFDADRTPTLLFDLAHALGEDHTEDATIEVDGGNIDGYLLLVGSYSARFGGVKTWFSAEVTPEPATTEVWAGDRVGVTLGWEPGTTELHLRVAVSSVDAAGAKANLAAELPDDDFDAREAEAEAEWRSALSTVRVRGGTESERRIFHTALYHAQLMPTTFYDVDGRYRGLDDAVHDVDFPYYTNFSLWDTFRTLHPWYALAWPDLQRDMAKSLVRMTEDLGDVPRWPLAHGETDGMVGTPADEVFAETWLKGIDGWDVNAAWDKSYEHAKEPRPNAGRAGVTEYVENGYVPFEAAGSPASLTLEYTWSDHALSLWAEALGLTEEAAELATQSDNYRNTWDEEQGYMVGRYADGSFAFIEDEFAWLDSYVEGNALHYRWAIPFDIEGLVDLEYGGDSDAFLDDFSTYWENVALEPDDSFPDDWYWHGNEPDIHNAFLASLAGDRDATADASRWVLANRYADAPAGLDGNDDSGTLSAWYLFASMGVYPIAGTTQYALGSPLFERVEIDRPDGMLVVEAPGASDEVRYPAEVRLGDQPVTGGTIDHAQWVEARRLVFSLE